MEYANVDFAISFQRNWSPDGFPEMKTIPNIDYEITSKTAAVRSGSNTSWVNNLFQYKAGSIRIYLLLPITVKHKT